MPRQKSAMRSIEIRAPLLLLLLVLPKPAEAGWKTEEITQLQIGRFVTGDLGNGSQLYALKYGNLYDGRIFEISHSSGNWVVQQLYSAGSLGSSVAIGSTCGPRKALFFGMENLDIIELTRSDDGVWRGKTIRTGIHPDEARIRSEYAIADLQELPLQNGSTIGVMVNPDIESPAFKCRDVNWGIQRVRYDVQRSTDSRGGTTRRFFWKDNYFLVHGEGDIHGDKTRRLFSTVIGKYSSEIFGGIFELTPRGKYWELKELARSSAGTSGFMTIGDGRGDGKSRLYAIHGGHIVEFRWSGYSLEKTLLGPASIPAGIAIGAFRGDGRSRVYVGQGPDIDEFTYSNGEWHSERISPHKGILKYFSSGEVSGTGGPGLFFSIENAGGLYRLRWEPGDHIIVAKFRHEGVPENESAAFSEMLRLRLVEIGNCAVLEREQLEDVLREREIQESGWSRAHAVRLGKLLNADKVVVGSMGILFHTRVMTMNSVSVASGEIERTEFRQWRDESEMENAVDDLARAICPSEVSAE